MSSRPGEVWELPTRRLRVTPCFTVNDLEMLCDAAIAGLGIARLPTLVCAEAIQRGQLMRVLGDASGPPVPLHALFPSRTFLPLRVRRFIDLLVERLAADGVLA